MIAAVPDTLLMSPYSYRPNVISKRTITNMDNDTVISSVTSHQINPTSNVNFGILLNRSLSLPPTTFLHQTTSTWKRYREAPTAEKNPKPQEASHLQDVGIPADVDKDKKGMDHPRPFIDHQTTSISASEFRQSKHQSNKVITNRSSSGPFMNTSQKRRRVRHRVRGNSNQDPKISDYFYLSRSVNLSAGIV